MREKQIVMNISERRLLNQQLVNPQMTDVRDLVEWMGMLQAQNYTMMRWAVGIRLKRPSMEAFRKAYDSGQIIRAHLFRCTWQLVAGEDLRWMLKLCAAKNKTAVRYYGRGIDDNEFEYANRLICKVLSKKQSMAKEELIGRLSELGLRGNSCMMNKFLQMAEASGLVCSGYLDDRQNTYALVDERVPDTGDLPYDESVALLARKYFRSHSPATLEDFVWWTNLGKGECRNAIASIAGELEQECCEGETYYIHRDCRVGGNCRKILLLPSYDEYLLGYKSRKHVIEKEFERRAYSKNGLFYPVIVQNGRVIGIWHPSQKTNFFNDECRVDISKLLLEYHKFINCM